ncbi:SH3 domain-containing protein [Inediibacterium massiliense]|uniref:SH3 domain-containing protein n=1 Tax=Inediibacterium massiliense TaxID=1658111 RepID=UPI001FA76F91|nr:SH3 domain-containing protein [Inediibacterium massiliense]
MMKPMIVVLLCILFGTMTYAQSPSKGTIIENGAILCKEPKASSQVIERLSLGEEIYIEDNHGRWYKISTKRGTFGWIHSEYVLLKKEEKPFIQNAFVNTESINIYKEANIESDIVGRLGFSTKIALVKRKDRWIEVSMGDEVLGWVVDENIQIIPHISKGKVLIESEILSKPSAGMKSIDTINKNTKVNILNLQDGYFEIEYQSKKGWILARNVSLIHEEFFSESFIKKEIDIKEEKEDNVTTYGQIIEDAKLLGNDYKVMAYDLSIGSCGKSVGSKYRGYTRTGINLNGKQWGEVMVVAVDSKKIPLGSKVLIVFDEKDWRSKYNGIYLAADTGGGVQGNEMDIYLGDGGNDRIQAVKDFGTANHVSVYLLN